MNIVFDLDGTLVDSAPDLRAAVNRMLNGDGLPPLDLATITSFVGNGLPKLVERALAASGVAASEYSRLYGAVSDFYNDAPADLTRPYPGVVAALDGLRAKGHKLGVCTNKPGEPARLVLDLLGLQDYFDVVIGGDSLAQKKPDPAPLLHGFDVLGPESQARLYVGDSEVDAETAQRAGIAFALFTEGYRKSPVDALPHDHRFSSFDALPGIVAALSASASVA